MKTILLTGGTGFLGSNVLKRLIESYSVILLKRSFSDTSRIKGIPKERVFFYDVDKMPLETVFSQNKIDVILHCATNYGRSEGAITKIVNDNLLFPLNLLNLSMKYRVSKFVNCDTILGRNVNEYSLSKKQFLDWLKFYSNDIGVVNLKLEQFYGPFDNESKFITFLARAFLENKPEIDLTDGYQKRCFTYIDDVVRAILLVLKNVLEHQVSYKEYLISSEEKISIRELVSLVKKIVGNTTTKLNFGAVLTRKNELSEYEIDISEIKKIGWIPKYLLEKGLKLMITYERKIIE
ncbi:MAG: NAD(P)-dependent oxidoreductase [Holosporaceae bacterium]|jgi:nucleoside-diphosphate-sugar epimerase|nr:NAD(P)-dependent oxidoreductase [Holosporaceae bacterium]